MILLTRHKQQPLHETCIIQLFQMVKWNVIFQLKHQLDSQIIGCYCDFWKTREGRMNENIHFKQLFFFHNFWKWFLILFYSWENVCWSYLKVQVLSSKSNSRAKTSKSNLHFTKYYYSCSNLLLLFFFFLGVILGCSYFYVPLCE